MADWSMMNHEWLGNQFDPYQYGGNPYYQEKPPEPYISSQAQSYLPPSSPALTLLLDSPEHHIMGSTRPVHHDATRPELQYVQTPPVPKVYVFCGVYIIICDRVYEFIQLITRNVK